MSKPTVAVIFGSRSTEHDVSIVTAIASIIRPLELSGKYSVVPVYIDKKGQWFSDPKLKDISLYTSGSIDTFLDKQKPISLRIGVGMEIVLRNGLKQRSIKVDIVFPATHGTHGEDGELMGMLEMANVAYVGCDLPSSVISMDKSLAKIIAQAAGIPTSRFVWFYARDFKTNLELVLEMIKPLKYPLFVKPVHLGSSIAISRVNNESDLINAIEVAAHYDDKVIVEEAVTNLIEVTVPIIGNDDPRPALVEQPMVKGEDFFDFDSKYMHGGKKGKSAKRGAQGYSKLPAPLPKKLYEKSEQTALEVYKAIGCKGIARVDLLIDSKTNKVYFNEVNTLPGSLYAHNFREAGISNVKLVEELVNLALERRTGKQKLTTSFSTSYLKQY